MGPTEAGKRRVANPLQDAILDAILPYMLYTGMRGEHEALSSPERESAGEASRARL
jgi:hypothetical protein